MEKKNYDIIFNLPYLPNIDNKISSDLIQQHLLDNKTIDQFQKFSLRSLEVLVEKNDIYRLKKNVEQLKLKSTIISFSVVKIIKPPSLERHGNTCFLNASLQFLFAIPKLVNTLYYSTYEEDTAAYYLVSIIQSLINKQKVNTSETVFENFKEKSYGLLNKEKNCNSQQDAGEYLQKLLYHLINDYKESVYPESDLNIRNQIEIQSLYEFRLLSVITCKQKMVSEKIEDYLMLNIAIPPTAIGLIDCIESHFKEGNIEYTHENKKMICKKKYTIQKSSPYLFINIKRYSIAKKNNSVIFIPLKLNISEYTSSTPISEYNLIGAIIHSGTKESGHYWAYIKNNNIWYKCDDSKIENIGDRLSEEHTNEINGEKDKQTSGYLFLYQYPIKMPI